MQKALFSGLAFLTLIVSSMVTPTISAEIKDFNGTKYEIDNSTNTSTVLGAPTYNQIRINIDNFMKAKEQGRNAISFMDQSAQEQRDFFHNYWKTNPFPTNDSATQLAIAKLTVARSNIITMQDVQSRNWYDVKTSHDKADILKNLQKYLANGRNSAPAYVDCNAWHNCTEQVFNPTVSQRDQYAVITNSTNSTK